MSHAVVHFEIHGPDPAALASFYSELLGWTITLMDGPMQYRMVDTGGGSGINGGLMANPHKAPMQIFYVECADLQAVLDRAAELGGTIAMPVMAIPDGPTIGAFTDPAGNVIGIVGAATGEVQGPSKGDGAPVSWFEIHGAPFDAQEAFYSELLGWKIGRFDGPDFTYGEIENPSAEYGTAGALSAPSSGFTGITIWAQVDDVAKYLEKAESLGASTDMAATTLPDGLTIGNFVDPQGNRLGLFTPPAG